MTSTILPDPPSSGSVPACLSPPRAPSPSGWKRCPLGHGCFDYAKPQVIWAGARWFSPASRRRPSKFSWQVLTLTR